MKTLVERLRQRAHLVYLTASGDGSPSPADDLRDHLLEAAERIEAVYNFQRQTHSIPPTRAICAGPDDSSLSIRCAVCTALRGRI